MEKNIFDIMSQSQDKIDAFFYACDDMLKTQYILADTKIEAILCSIASSKVLYKLFADVLKDFDYKNTAKKCIVDGAQFVMPQDPKKAAALGFNILLDLDKKTMILKDFLHFFAGDSNPNDFNDCFDNFLNQLILPFKNAIKSLFDLEAEEIKARKEADAAIEGRKRRRLEFDRIIATFAARINADTTLNIIAKDEIAVLCGELLNCVNKGEKLDAQKTYSKLYKKIKAYKPKLIPELEKIEIEII